MGMLGQYLKASRPKFWLYLLGPYLIGIAAASRLPVSLVNTLIFALYFTFPANFLIYGVNDLFDYETDKRQFKKRTYEILLIPEQSRRFVRSIWLWNVPVLMVWLISDLPLPVRVGLLGFVFLGVFYSAPPIRAKTKPLFDSVFNSFYIFPGMVGYGLATEMYPPLQLVIAASLWCMGLHAYAAIPDIVADSKAGIRTIATRLGYQRTLLFSLACFIGAVGLSVQWLGIFSGLAGMVYCGIVLISLINPQRHHVFRLYKWFPLINTAAGIGLFFWITQVLK